MVLGTGDLAWNESLSSSCQSLTIFKRLGTEPTSFEAIDTIGRTFTTLFMTLSGLPAFNRSFVPLGGK
jgi:hypothetical protein